MDRNGRLAGGRKLVSRLDMRAFFLEVVEGVKVLRCCFSSAGLIGSVRVCEGAVAETDMG